MWRLTGSALIVYESLLVAGGRKPKKQSALYFTWRVWLFSNGLACCHPRPASFHVAMTAEKNQAIEQVLKSVYDPHTGKDFVASGAVREIKCEDGTANINIVLGYPAASCRENFKALIRNAVQASGHASEVKVSLNWDIQSHTVQKSLKPLKSIKNIIAVASGKGGVGKSTTAINLALALSAEGANVGILDADIYGPSQPTMLGVKVRPDTKDGKTLEPLENHGIQGMSIGFLIDETTPMIWRGPMVTQALEQLLSDTNWRDLDYLVIDLPPGTGDVQLTLAQKIPVSGAVIVTTPQNIALLDARRGAKMFEKVDVPILGIVENMSTHICSQCHHEEPIFGTGGGALLAEEYGMQLLGSLPLDLSIREQTDSGRPTVVADPAGKIAAIYKEIARKVAAQLAGRRKDYSARFPKIVIENT